MGWFDEALNRAIVDVDLADDRITCTTDCANWRGTCTKLGYTPAILVRRCEHFAASPKTKDKRTGAERWPNLMAKPMHKTKQQKQ